MQNSGALREDRRRRKSEVFALIRRIEERGAHVYIPRKDHDYMIGVGLRMLTLRRIVDERDGLLASAGRK